MPTYTPNFNFALPLVNSTTDQDLWGGYLNSNFSALDGDLGGFVSTTGTNNVIIGGTTAPIYSASLTVEGTGTNGLWAYTSGSGNAAIISGIASTSTNFLSLAYGTAGIGGTYTYVGGLKTDGTNTVLDGTWKATTPATNDSSTTLATTAYVTPGNSIAANGYRKMPDGSIEQWGTSGSAPQGGYIDMTFPIPFPSAVYSIVATPIWNGNAINLSSTCIANISTSGCRFYNNQNVGGPALPYYWRAVGK